MGVQFMQSEGLLSQLLQVGNLLHIGQHEACHNWKHGEALGGGYFKALLEGEEAPISSQIHVHTPELDTKPLSIMAHTSLAAKVPTNTNLSSSTIQAANSASNGVNSANNGATIISLPSHARLEPKPSPIISPLKRAREAAGQNEGLSKREKKGSEEGSSKKKEAAAGGATAAAAGLKASGVKTKVPKPAPAVEPPRTDYVHVRARRGQATDSHSLAERVRREKISERMRFLQDLVPGCSKITGKALILDEIINYVQSLQNQVEFLAMRLAAINPKIEYASLSNSRDEEIASPFVEEVRDCVDMLPKAITTPAPTLDLHFDGFPAFYPSLFDESNFTSSIVSDLSTSTCNESDLTNMDFSHLG